MFEPLHTWLTRAGLGEPYAAMVIESLEVLGVILLAFVAHVVAKRVTRHIVHQIAVRTRTDWDDVMVARRMFRRLAHMAPALVIYAMAPLVFTLEKWIIVAQRGSQVYMTLVGLLVLDSLLNTANDIYQRFEISRRFPILGYLQVVKILLSGTAAVFVISIIIDRSPWVLISGLGALTAVILLIFKDSILGLVAGVQLVANDMVRPGDWIEMPKYGADGDVMEINLNTVKVRNWDKTITTIPTYALISDSFKNWRGMQESGGRRIKRSLHIDVSSIRFCTPEMIEKFSKIEILRDYIDEKQKELAEYNEQHGIDDSVFVNGRRMTNVGTFRAYLTEYLQRHPKIHQHMTFLVRQLQPTEKGLPIEIYVFSNDQRWAYYEAIQADIFDHIFAALPWFELRPFQNPTGQDIAAGVRGLANQSHSP